jgi:signal transduction histidine kinase
MPQDDSAPSYEPLKMLCISRDEASQSLDGLVGVSVEFSYALLHDLRQPVSAILFNAQAALKLFRKNEPSGQPIIEESLKDIINEVDRLKTLLQGLGTYLGLDRDDISGLDVNKAVTSALGLLSGESVRRKMRLSTNLGLSLPALRISPSLLTRAVIALALDFFQALETAPTDLRQICVWTGLSEGYVKIGFQARTQAFLEGKGPLIPLQLQSWGGRIFVSQELPDKITWGIELPTHSDSSL